MIVDELHNPENGLKVILHIGNLDVRNGTTRRKALKLRLKLQLLERINLFCYMHVIAVGDIALVRNTGNDTKTTLESLGKLIGCRLKRCAIDGVIDILGSLPLVALVVHVLHNLERKWRSFCISMAVARHGFDALIQTGIPQ